MSRLMTKLTKWLFAQRKLRSVWASAQSDQSSLCAQWVAKDPSFLHADIEDSGCRGWSEFSLGAQSFCWFCHEASKVWMIFLPYFSTLCTLNNCMLHSWKLFRKYDFLRRFGRYRNYHYGRNFWRDVTYHTSIGNRLTSKILSMFVNSFNTV